MSSCSKCGAVIAPGAQFCSTCGTAVAPAADATQPQGAEPGFAAGWEPGVPHRKTRWGVVVGILVVGALVVGLSVAGIAAVVSSNDSDSAQDRGAFSGGSTTEHDWPAHVEENFLTTCDLTSGGNTQTCQCALAELQDRYTLAEFADLERRVVESGIPPELTEIMSGCL